MIKKNILLILFKNELPDFWIGRDESFCRDENSLLIIQSFDFLYSFNELPRMIKSAFRIFTSGM
jgi:hypothetical protein